MSHVEKLLRLKDFSESFALTAAECVATEDGITRYSFFDPDGTFYSYSDVEQVETGFKGKLLGIHLVSSSV